MTDISGCQISNNNLAVYLQGVSVQPSSTITTDYFVTASLPSSAENRRVWNFTTQGTITGTSTLTLDYTQAHTACPAYNITFEGALNGTLTIHNQVFSANKYVSYQLTSPYVLVLTLHIPKKIVDCYGGSSTQAYSLDVNINDSATTYNTMSGSAYYRIVPTDYISVEGYQILNIVVSYTNFSYTGTLDSFTSYLDYTVDGKTTVYPTSISFLNGNTVNDSTGASITMPINASTTDLSGNVITPSNVFILPLVQIPTGATFNAGYVVNTTNNGLSYTSIYTVASSDMSFLRLHIYDNTSTTSFQGLPLPSATNCTFTSVSGSSSFTQVKDSLNLSVDDMLTLYSINDYVYALYNGAASDCSGNYTPTTTNQQTFLNQTPSTFYSSSSQYPLIYYSTAECGASVVFPGYYFSSTPGDVSGVGTSGDYLITSIKNNNYSIPGLVTPTSPSPTPSYSLTYSNNTLSISTNTIAVSPRGQFPYYDTNTQPDTVNSQYILVNCPAVYVNPEGGPVGAIPTSFNLQCPPQQASGTHPCTLNPVGFSLCNNFVLPGVDDALQNTEPKEAVDFAEHHINTNWGYHYHKTPAILYDFVSASTTPYVCEWAMDGNPVFTPIIINVTDYYTGTTIPPYVLDISGQYYQWMTSQFLDIYHGLPGSYTIGIQDTTTTGTITNATFNYAYFSTPDFPFIHGGFKYPALDLMPSSS